MKRGVGLSTYNRADNLGEVIESIYKTAPADAKIVVADDGSTDNTAEVVKEFNKVLYVRGSNRGVGFNKNRILFALQDCEYIAIIEDDLKCLSEGWFEAYETVARHTGTHHFCRVQDKEISETHSTFSKYVSTLNYTPIFGASPRGDFSFITSRVISVVGSMHPNFAGVGMAHGEYAERIVKAGLIPHPLNWIDLKEPRDMFEQIGDTKGGRWDKPKNLIKAEIRANKKTYNALKEIDYVFHPLVFE